KMIIRFLTTMELFILPLCRFLFTEEYKRIAS
ncbi:MAG: hypothetical protein ACI81T_003184, partial [Bacteroidia bacterium]